MTDPAAAEETDLLDEPRLFPEVGVAARVAEVCAPALRDLGFRLVRVKILSTNGCTVQIMAERADGSFSIDDCEEASRALSPVLDVADPIDKAYYLEVSSPGIDRSLMRRSDFERWRGHEAKVALNAAIDGKRRLRGLIEAIDREGIKLKTAPGETGQALLIDIPFALMSETRLVLTDALIKASLKGEAITAPDSLSGEDEGAPAKSSGKKSQHALANGQADKRRKRHGG